MRKAVIFDVDGTLWDAVSVITDSWNNTLQGFPDVTSRVTYEVMRNMMGKTMDEFVTLFPELSMERAAEVLEYCCQEEINYLHSHPGILYPGIRDILETLHEQYELYIVSNCQNGYIEALLHSCNLSHLFEGFECFGRTGKKKGQNIQILMQRYEIDKAIYIGDTQMDQEAAEYAGIPFIFAKYGMGQAQCTRFMVNEPKEIPEEICKMKYFAL